MKIIKDDIAIIGMACIFPRSPDIRSYWENVLSKQSCLSDHPDPETAKFIDPNSNAFERIYNARGGFLGELAQFDPIKYGIMPADVQGGDPDQFLALSTASAAIEDAGLDLDNLPRDRIAVTLGHSTYPTSGNVTWFQHGTALDQTIAIVRHLNPGLSDDQADVIRQALKQSLPPVTAQTPATIIPNIVAGRIANRFDLMGGNYNVDAACASSHIAVYNGVKDLMMDKCDYVITGGVQASCLVLELMLFCTLKAMSHHPALRPFDKNADGTMLGEGVGILLLQRKKDAQRDGNRIYALIKGMGIASDGKAQAMLAPRLEGQVLAIQRAYEDAQIDPRSVELVEAHGTGIPIGDLTEIRALTRVFGQRTEALPTCGIGSVKSMIGHLRSAAGAAGMIKAVLALHHKILPPTLNCDAPHPELELEKSPFYINTTTRPWIHDNLTPRRAGVSAMGFGGIDAHCVLEEYVEN